MDETLRLSNGYPRNDPSYSISKTTMHLSSFLLMPNLILTSSIIILSVVRAAAFDCAGSPFPFGILPCGDQYVRYGRSLTLYCVLNASHPEAVGCTSENLSFFSAKGNTRQQIKSTILNDTTIVTVLEGLSLGEHYIHCALKDDSRDREQTCPTFIEVGYEPQKVTNFSCVSWNWEQLECKWYPPETYINKTEYKLSLSGGKKTFHSCPEHSNGMKNMCVLTANTDTVYRQPHEIYTFHLTGTNPLGNYTTVIKFNHYAHVIPKKPENVVLVNKTIGSAVVNWSVPFPMTFFPKGLRTKIEYKSKWDPPWKWKVIPIEVSKYKSSLYNITGLEYAHTSYDVRIYLQSGAAIGDSFWSEPGTLTFITPSTVPGKPPDTTFGSFHITYKGNESDVIVYWNVIPENMENGENFSYEVTCLMNNKYDCGPPIEKSLSYAKFGLSNGNEYLFTVYSVNMVGQSSNSSRVHVPKLGFIPRPEGLTNVPHANGVHELSWKAVDHKNLSNYTIFWCEDDQSLTLPCKGIVKWIEVEKNVTDINITMNSVKKFYKFAIAANFIDGSSSGMVWFTCFVLHDKVEKVVNEVIIGNTGSREVDIVWQIECAQSSSFGGYYLYYCPVLSPQNNDCQENYPEHKLFVKEFGKRNITLTNLKPYTTYRLQMSVMSYNGTEEKIGPRSKSLRFTTLEDSPSEPLNLRRIRATNSSITLAWDVPVEMNGILQKYKLNIESQSSREGRTIAFEAKDSSNSFVTQYEITELSTHTAYKFSLRACTSDVKCSHPSLPLFSMTRAGIPGKMAWPRIINNNNTMAEIAWEEPNIAAGLLNYYEVSVSVNSSFSKVFNVTGTRAEIPLVDCNATIRIRAINVDGNDVYEGPWSEPVLSRCDTLAGSNSMALFAWIASFCMFSVILAVMFYIAKRGWIQCRKMKDVEVKLPPGLQCQDLEKDNQDYLNMDGWPPRPTDTIQCSLGSELAPDEESLLGKKSEECLDHVTRFNIAVKNGGDSSGCSVGRESLSSSLTSDNHGSTDSGAEADQCLNTGAAFGNWDSLKHQPSNTSDTSSKNREYVQKGTYSEEPPSYSNESDWSSEEPATSGYTRVGFTDGPAGDKSLPGKGYVTIANMPPLNSRQKNVNEESYNPLQLDSFPLLFDQDTRDSHDSGGKASGNLQTSAPDYVTLACLQERKMTELIIPRNVPDFSRQNETDNEESQTVNGLFKEESEELTQYNSSVDEIEGERSSSRNSNSMPPYVSITENRSLAGSIDPAEGEQEEKQDESEGEGKEGNEEEEGEREEEEEDGGEGEEGNEEEEGEREDEEGESEEEEKEKEGGDEKKTEKEDKDGGLSINHRISSKENINGIGSALIQKKNKDSETYSNYTPHRLFEKGKLHTQ